MNIPFSIANNWAEALDDWEAVPWVRATGLVDRCYVAYTEGQWWEIRMNDFPEEPLYTLFIAGEEILHFDNWPSFWVRPD